MEGRGCSDLCYNAAVEQRVGRRLPRLQVAVGAWESQDRN
jgi:hypothetical protein